MTFTRLVSALIFALAAGTACADQVIKPLPEPDLSRVDKASAARLQENRANFEKARKELVGPPLAQSYALIASSYLVGGFPDVAAVALDNAVALAPDDGRWLYLQGVLAEQRNQPPADALGFYERAFLVDKEYLPIRVALIATLANQGNVERARTIADEGMKDFGDTAVLQMVRAQIALKQKRYADAISAASDGIKIDDQATQLYAIQAAAYDGLNNAAAAKAAREKAGDVQPLMADPLRDGFLGGGHGQQQPAAGAQPDAQSSPLLRATFYLSAGQFDPARKELDAALKEKPGDVGILGLYARTEALAGNKAGAASRAAEAVRLAPNDGQSYVTRGIVEETSGDEDAARGDYERAIKLDPKLVEPRLLLGHYLMRKGQYAQAGEQYRQIIAIDPQRYETYGNLVAAQYSAGRCADALKDLNEAMRANQRQGFLVQVFARTASTCPAANETERSMALKLAGEIYKQSGAPQIAESLAVAQAANGNFKEATQVQGAAIFTAVRDAGQASAAPFQEFFKAFQANQVPKLPWPSNSPFFKPERLQPAPQRPAAKPQG